MEENQMRQGHSVLEELETFSSACLLGRDEDLQALVINCASSSSG